MAMQPTPTTTTSTSYLPVVAVKKAHPIRGILWGLMLGIGAAAMAIILRLIPFDQLWALVVVAAGVVLGTLWSIFGPARKPKGPPPQRVVVAPAEAVSPGYAAPGPAAATTATSAATAAVDDDLRIEPLDVEPFDLGPEPASHAVPESMPESMPAPESTREPTPQPAPEPTPDATPKAPPDAMPDAMPEPPDPPVTLEPPERTDPPPPPPPN